MRCRSLEYLHDGNRPMFLRCRFSGFSISSLVIPKQTLRSRRSRSSYGIQHFQRYRKRSAESVTAGMAPAAPLSVCRNAGCSGVGAETPSPRNRSCVETTVITPRLRVVLLAQILLFVLCSRCVGFDDFPAFPALHPLDHSLRSLLLLPWHLGLSAFVLLFTRNSSSLFPGWLFYYDADLSATVRERLPEATDVIERC